MKILLVFLFTMIGLNGFSQSEIISYYFSQASLRNLDEVKSFADPLLGTYEPEDNPKNEVRRAAGEHFMLDETGVYLEKNKLLSITKEEVRENSQYLVRNGWLHGVMENDSIPCALDDEQYFFLFPSKTYLYELTDPMNKLYQVKKNGYAIFSYEDNGHYSVIYLTYAAGKLQLFEVDLAGDGEKGIQNIATREKLDVQSDFDTYLLTPTKEEWETFVFTKCLVLYDTYTKLKE